MSVASTSEPIGLIGAGLMGTAFTRRMLAAGFRVLVWDCDASRIAALVALGAERAVSAVDIGASAGRMVLSLPDSKIVGSVIHETAGNLRAGSIILDTSTGEPAEAVEFADFLRPRGVAYLDATISGSSAQLERGEALCMVGGDAEAFARCADLLAAFGGRAIHVGANGDGSRMKLVTNLVLGLNRAALAEGLSLAESMGLNLPQTLAVLQASAAYSRVMDSKGVKMIEGDFTPVARLSQHLKDVRLILRAAEQENLQLPLSETHRRLLEQAEAEGFGDLDNSAIIRVLRRRSP